MSLCSAFVLALLATAMATEVKNCPGRSEEGLSDKVTLIPCKKLPCRLKKGTNQHINIKFILDSAEENLVNSVTAEVFGVNLPFVGVDGASVCDKIYTPSGEQAACPLKAGTEYIYKDQFPVHSIYPSIPVNVHWALKNAADKVLVCFEVPVRIQ